MHVLVRGGRTDRDADREIIENDLKSKDPNARRQAQIAKDRINGETAKIAAMREALVKAHRNGDKNEIADIHSFIERKPEYRNGW